MHRYVKIFNKYSTIDNSFPQNPHKSLKSRKSLSPRIHGWEISPHFIRHFWHVCITDFSRRRISLYIHCLRIFRAFPFRQIGYQNAISAKFGSCDCKQSTEEISSAKSCPYPANIRETLMKILRVFPAKVYENRLTQCI